MIASKMWVYLFLLLALPALVFADDNWQQAIPQGDVPAARFGHSLVMLDDGLIYIFGGQGFGAQSQKASGSAVLNSGPVFNDLARFNATNGIFEKITPENDLPPGRKGHAAVKGSDGKMYILFGMGASGLLNDIWTYDPTTNLWEEVAVTGSKIPEPRMYHSAVIINDVIYIYGGQDSAGDALKETWGFNPAGGDWVEKTGHPYNLSYGHGAVAVDEKMVIQGGEGQAYPYPDLWVYDPAADSWQYVAVQGDVPSARSFQMIAYKAGKIWIGGGKGEDASGTVTDLSDTWEYDVASNTWTQKTDGPQQSMGKAAPVTSGSGQGTTHVFMFGGQRNGTPLDETWQYYPDGTPSSTLTPCLDQCPSEVLPFAALSKDAYESVHGDPALPGGWAYVVSQDMSWGFAASLYVHTGEKKIVLAYKGPETTDAMDIYDDMASDIGTLPLSYLEAAQTILQLIDVLQNDPDYQGYELMVTGHASGGGMAQFLAAIFDLNGYTFNTTPPHPNVGDITKTDAYLDAYVNDLKQLDVLGIGGSDNDILNVVAYNSLGTSLDTIPATPSDLYGTTKSLEIDDAVDIGTLSGKDDMEEIIDSVGTLFPDLELSMYTVSLSSGESVTVDITGGSGQYTVTSDDPFVASVIYILDDSFTITATSDTALSAKTATITVKDYYNQSENVSVTVEEPSALAYTCGAYVAPGVWKEFECYNLGVDESNVENGPFSPSWSLIGGYWQWGWKGPGALSMYDTNNERFAHGPTSEDVADANSGSISSWYYFNDIATDDQWSDSMKTSSDPCPDGFRVPSISQWMGVVDNNTQSVTGTWSYDATNYTAARFFGNDLMLPAAGYRDPNHGELTSRGNSGRYWSATFSGYESAMFMGFGEVTSGNWATSNRRNGNSIRCIAE